MQDPHKRVFINPNRTPKKHDVFNALRAERLKTETNAEKDLVIRNNKIVKNKQMDNELERTHQLDLAQAKRFDSSRTRMQIV